MIVDEAFNKYDVDGDDEITMEEFIAEEAANGREYSEEELAGMGHFLS